MTTQTLEADSMWLEFGGRKILQSIYLKMETGRVTGLLGRNGTGKSSILRMMFGTLRGQNQSVRYNGHFISHPYLEAGLVRYLPQSPFAPKDLKVLQLCKMYKVCFAEMINYFPELEDYEREPVRHLSGGKTRLFETLLILLSPVQFVLLDEPFTHIPPVMVEQLSNVITELKKQKGILISDHSYKNVLNLSDDTYLIVPVGRSLLLKNPESELRSLGYTS